MFDDKANCLFVPKFLQYQFDKINPNIVKSLVKQSELIPESSLKEIALRNLLFFIKDLSPVFGEVFTDVFQKENGKTFQESYGDFEKDNAFSFAKITPFLSQRFRDFLLKPVNSKQLTGKPLKPPSQEEPIAKGNVDLETGEILENGGEVVWN